MSAPKPTASHDLSDFAELLADLEREGIDHVVIGGCAVGVYARLAGEGIFSADLDIYLSEKALSELLEWAKARRIRIEKRPQPRSVPVAMFHWRGLEVNALTASIGLPDIDVALQSCRKITSKDAKTHAYIADPFELLANKLKIKRDKDLPHIELLKRYLELEVRELFAAPGSPRERLMPAKRFLQVLDLAYLPSELSRALIPLADLAPLRRFLASTLGGAPDLQQELLARASDEEERIKLQAIMKSATG